MKVILPKLDNPTKNKIIEQVATQADVKAFVFNACRQYKELREDLYQELFISLLKIDELILIELYQKEELHFKIIGIVKGMLQGNRSTFYTKYIKPIINKVQKPSNNQFLKHHDTDPDDEDALLVNSNEVNDLRKDEYEEFIGHALEVLEGNVEDLYHWDKEILDKFLKEGTRTKVSEKYGINFRYVSEAMQRNMNALKESIEAQIELPDHILPEFSVISPYTAHGDCSEVVKKDTELNASALWIKYRNLPSVKSETLEQFNEKNNNHYDKKKK